MIPYTGVLIHITRVCLFHVAEQGQIQGAQSGATTPYSRPGGFRRETKCAANVRIPLTNGQYACNALITRVSRDRNGRILTSKLTLTV